jgi:hypothetical protein
MIRIYQQNVGKVFLIEVCLIEIYSFCRLGSEHGSILERVLYCTYHYISAVVHPGTSGCALDEVQTLVHLPATAFYNTKFWR